MNLNIECAKEVNLLLIWKIAELFFLKKEANWVNSFRAIIASNFPTGHRSLEESLVLNDNAEFQNLLANLTIDDEEFGMILDTISELINDRRSTFSKVSSRVSHEQAVSKFNIGLNSDKNRSRSQIERLKCLQDKNDKIWPDHLKILAREVMGCLRIMAGDVKYMASRFSNNILILLCCYIAFGDPCLNKEGVLNLKREYEIEGINSGDQEINDSNLLFDVFENVENQHSFLQIVSDKMAPWFVFHFGDLLIINKNLPLNKKFQGKEKLIDYSEYLVSNYVNFLSKLRIEFDTFLIYYERVFDFEGNINFEALIAFSKINFNQKELLSCLKERKCGWILSLIFEEILEEENQENLKEIQKPKILNKEKIKNDKIRTIDLTLFNLIEIFYFIESARLARKLMIIIYKRLEREFELKEITGQIDIIKRLINQSQKLKNEIGTSHVLFEEIQIFLQIKLMSMRDNLSLTEVSKICAYKFGILDGMSNIFTIILLNLLVSQFLVKGIEKNTRIEGDVRRILICEFMKMKTRNENGELESISPEFDINFKKMLMGFD